MEPHIGIGAWCMYKKSTHRYIILKPEYYTMLGLEYKIVDILINTLKDIGIV